MLAAPRRWFVASGRQTEAEVQAWARLAESGDHAHRVGATIECVNGDDTCPVWSDAGSSYPRREKEQ